MSRFPDKARICFVGDSITHIGTYLTYIVAQYRKNFPDSSVEFYNCGISGGNLGNTIRVFDEDIAIYQPTHIVLMIGANDTRRWALDKLPSPKYYDLLHTAYQDFGDNLERFYRITRDRHIELILCTPMPYAEYIPSKVSPLSGGAALFLSYADRVRQFAKNYALPLCDYHAAAVEAMQTQSLYNPDRVHPNEAGHFLMAKTFLSFQGITLDEWAEIPTDLQEWYDTTQKLRHIITAEFLNIPTYADMTHEQRIAAMGERHDQAQTNPEAYDPMARFRIEFYPIHKPHQDEYVAAVKQFMKKQ